jgi:hypothetical protein
LTIRSVTQCLLFPKQFEKPVVAQFDEELGSSDGGAILLKGVEDRLGLIGGLADAVEDRRQPGKVQHELADLVAQRIYAIACGYADGNDAGRLADDPILKMLLDRDPVEGDSLASQPTVSRFENSVGPKDLYRMGRALAEKVIERHRRRLRGRARKIVVDLDSTDDPTHGAQQLAFFHGYYDTWCYLPLLGFLTFDDEAEQHLFAAVLRPGNAAGHLGAISILRRVLERLRKAFPKARILVRLDAGFACPQLFDFLDGEKRVDYVVAMGKNSVLKRLSEPTLQKAREKSEQSGESERVYGGDLYAAKTWPYERRVVFKAEVTRFPGRKPKDNPRYLITSLRHSPRFLYERIYCPRGDAENRLKELFDLEIDRTSCPSFWANQCRVLLTAAAFVLFQEIRLQARATSLARAQVRTLREHLLKLGVRVVVSARRIVLHLPASYPFIGPWRRVALGLGAARPG